MPYPDRNAGKARVVPGRRWCPRRFQRYLLLWVVPVALWLIGPALADVVRTSDLLAKGTRWENPYYIIDTGVDGPTLLVTGGLHGNEPAGACAAGQIRHWPLKRGRLIVVPRINTPGLAEISRWLPGEPKATRNANRNFPRTGEPNEARSIPIQALWTFIQERKPDWVVDLHEGFDFHIVNAKSDGSSIVYFDSPEMERLASAIQAEVNATIEDPKRQIVKRSGGPVNGSLVRAAIERLGARGFCFETTFKDQPLSTRTRQHRVMVHRLMRELDMAAAGPDVLTSGDWAPVIRVAFYDAAGAFGDGVKELQKLLGQDSMFELSHVGPPDVRVGVLEQFDVVVFPGGSGSGQASAIGDDGRRQVRQFVQEGGGFVGVCAGAYLASAQYEWSLAVTNAGVLSGTMEVPGEGTKEMWLRGSGDVDVEFTEAGRRILGASSGIQKVRYVNGPILSPGTRDDLPAYVPLAYFRSEISKYQPQEGTMVGTPAIVSAPFGKGRVLVLSPHLELSKDLAPCLARGIAWTAASSSTTGRADRGDQQ